MNEAKIRTEVISDNKILLVSLSIIIIDNIQTKVLLS